MLNFKDFLAQDDWRELKTNATINELLSDDMRRFSYVFEGVEHKIRLKNLVIKGGIIREKQVSGLAKILTEEGSWLICFKGSDKINVILKKRER